MKKSDLVSFIVFDRINIKKWVNVNRVINTKKALINSVAAFAVLLPFYGTVSYAQNPQNQPQPINSIEVLVNDDPISSFDIDERLRLVIAISGGIKSQEELEKVREQVIRSMVDERLQLQEAVERGVNIPQQQLDEFFQRRAEGLGQTPEELSQALSGIGSSKRTMVGQMHAEYAWSQLVNGLLSRSATPSDDEVEGELQRLKDNKGKFEYRLQEIILIVSDPSQQDSVRSNAQALVDRLRDGAQFGELAQQISASSSAAVGGDMGWATENSLPTSYIEAISDLEIGEVTDPIRTPGGFSILLNRDRRRIMIADPLDTQLIVNQLFLSLDKTNDEQTVTQFRRIAEPLAENGAECDAIETLVKQSGASDRATIGAIRLRDVKGDIRAILKDMEPGSATPVMDMEDGLRVMIVCDRQEAVANEPEYDDILNQLQQQRLTMMSRRFLRDLRRDAIVDYR